MPILLFAYVGFEAPNAAGEEMRNPRRDVPVSIGVSGAVATCCYLLPVFAVLAVVPAERITGVGGFLDAASLVFGSYGAAGHAMLAVTSALFVLVLMTQGSAWMIVSDRMQAMAAADGGFFSRSLGAFHPRLGTPVRMNLVSGVTATAFMLAATLLVDGSAAAVFKVVLTVAVTTLLLSYLVVVPALGTLRRNHPDVQRPYRVPFGRWGFRISLGLVYAWIALGSWIALFPGVLEHALGVGYDFAGTWGVSRTVFETFTLGTVAVLLALGVAGRAVAVRADRRTPPAPVTEILPEYQA
ncbi:hypothetical protein GCM10025734_07390 [Kitasatospora paranensis]